MFKLEQQQYKYLEAEKDPEKQKLLAKAFSANPLKYFVPTGKQEDVIKIFANSTKKNKVPVIWLSFANGTGKTQISCQICLNLILKPQNGWFDYPLFRNFPFPKKIWYISTPDALNKRIIPYLQSIVPSDLYTPRKCTRGIDAFIFKNGWCLYFKSYEQKTDSFESDRIGVIILDEPAPEPIWEACKGRAQMGTIFLLPMTPLDMEPYIMDEIDGNISDGHGAERGYYKLTANIYSSCKRRGVRGYLDPDTVDDNVSKYSANARAARAFGEPQYYARKEFPELDRDKHFVRPEDYPIKSDYLLFHVVDPHDGRYPAEIWAALTPEGRYIIFDEMPDDKSLPFWEINGKQTIEEHISKIRLKENKILANIERDSFAINNNIGLRFIRIMDRHFGEQTRGGKTYKNIYVEKGGNNFIFLNSYSGGAAEIEYGHQRIRSLLSCLPDGKPGLVYWNTCYHAWNAITHYITRPRRNNGADRASWDTKIVEKYKDFVDATRYLVCHNVSNSFVDDTEYESFDAKENILEYI